MASRREIAQEIIEQLQDHRFGMYRGVVENNADPEGLDRVQVRIHDIHGDETSTAREVLPWAEINVFGCGGYDSGSALAAQMVPGSTVWVQFEKGHINNPVVMGGWRGRPQFAQEMRTVSGKRTTDPDEPFDENAPWVPPEQQNETPKDVYFRDGAEEEFEDSIPTRTVHVKTTKGHTILTEERDGQEYLHIIDRSGQAIEMSCGVAATPGDEEDAIAPNRGNIEQRGVRSALRGDQLRQDAMVPGKSYIRLKDLAGQEILLDASRGNERIVLQNQNREGSKTQRIELGLNKGEPRILIEGANGDRFVIDSESPTPIVLADHAGNQLVFDAANRRILEIGNGKKEIELSSMSETFSGDRTMNIGGNLDQTVNGNYIGTVVNDQVLNVMGNMQYSVGGAMNFTTTGLLVADPVPTALDYSYDLLMYGPALVVPPAGIAARKNSHRIRINQGDMVRQMTEGDYRLRTAEGDLDWETLLGDILMHIGSGNFELTQDAGTLKIDVTPAGANKATIEVDASGNIHLVTGNNDLLMDQALGESTLTADTVNVVSQDINLSAKTQTDFFMAFTAWLNIWTTWHTAQYLAHVHTSSAPGSPTSPPTLGIVPPNWTPCRSTYVKANPTG